MRWGIAKTPTTYDFETLWELNPDNGEGRKNRCIEVESVNFCGLILRDNIKSLVEGYDYVAAFRLAEQCASIPQQAKSLLEGCVRRMRLDESADSCFRGYAGHAVCLQSCREVGGVSGGDGGVSASGAMVRLPSRVDPCPVRILFKRVERVLPPAAWLESKEEGGHRVYRVVWEKVSENGRFEFGVAVAQSWAEPSCREQSSLLRAQKPVSAEVYEPYGKLRNMECKARNRMAHEISRVSKRSLEKEAGISFKESMDLLFDLADAKAKRRLYARINEELTGLL